MAEDDFMDRKCKRSFVCLTKRNQESGVRNQEVTAKTDSRQKIREIRAIRVIRDSDNEK